MGVETAETGKPPGLVRDLGLWAATAVVIGAMTGQSVFLVGSNMSREVGSMWKVLVVWIVGGVVVLIGALCYAELGAAMQEAGGDYTYLGLGIGPLWGFLFGWTSSMIMRPGSAAIIGRALAPGGISCCLCDRAHFRLEPSHSTPVTAVPVYIQRADAYPSPIGVRSSQLQLLHGMLGEPSAPRLVLR